MDIKQLLKIKLSAAIVFAVVMLLCIPVFIAKASTASAISFGTIDYEALTLQVYKNNNTIVYYSTDNSQWEELEASYNSTTRSYNMDISWVSNSSDVTLYFKGDINKTVKTITIPAQNNTFSVVFDKADGTFTFNNAEESDTFEWRKSSDYYWKTVNLDDGTSSYQSFLTTVDKFRVTGATIIIRLPQKIGTGVDDVGIRTSKEITVSITTRATAPAVKVNSSRLTLNTTTAMEYYDSESDLWVDCSTNMNLDEIAPQVLYENGAKSAILKIRRTQTSTTPYSKTATIMIPAQTAAPIIFDSSSDVSYYYMNSKLMLQFNNASATKMYEYAIVKEDADYSVTTAAWRTVKSSSVIALSSSVVPDGCTVYVRKKGTDASTKTDVVLASAVNSFIVKY